MEKTKRVYFWADSLFIYYSLAPIITELQKQNIEVVIVTLKTNKTLLSDYLNIPEKNILSYEKVIERLGESYKSIRLAEKLFVSLKVSPKFSVMYKRVRANDSLRWVSKFTPKLKSTEINKKYHTFFAKKVPDLFEGSPVISATINRWPYLLAGSKNVVNVMESWDHPIKRPFFLNPAITFTWNKKLGQDIQAHQGLKEWDTIFPLKFRYIEDFKSYSVAELKENLTEKYKKDLSEIKDDTIMYVVSTSSRNAKAFDGELKLIRQLITFCNQHQKSLYIKPKPNGKQGEFDEFSSLQNVQIGLYGEGEQSECMLDDNYHKYRLALLKSVNLVINVYTTFALEAALVGVPILQLSLENSTTFGHFAELINNPHIKNYFLEGKPYIHYNGHPNELDQKLNSGEITTLSQSYTKAIYSWINPTLTIKESVNKIISRLDL